MRFAVAEFYCDFSDQDEQTATSIMGHPKAAGGWRKNTGAREYGISRGENGAWRRRFATSGYGADGDSRSLFIWIFDTYLLLL